jgi:hypothetical protein
MHLRLGPNRYLGWVALARSAKPLNNAGSTTAAQQQSAGHPLQVDMAPGHPIVELDTAA